jgi:hypothetical protein
MNRNERTARECATWLTHTVFVVLILGAGASAECGIATFAATDWCRKAEEEGWNWKQFKLTREDISSPLFFSNDGTYKHKVRRDAIPLTRKIEIWNAYWDFRFAKVQGIEPGEPYELLAAILEFLQSIGKEVCVMTTNVDGFCPATLPDGIPIKEVHGCLRLGRFQRELSGELIPWPHVITFSENIGNMGELGRWAELKSGAYAYDTLSNKAVADAKNTVVIEVGVSNTVNTSVNEIERFTDDGAKLIRITKGRNSGSGAESKQKSNMSLFKDGASSAYRHLLNALKNPDDAPKRKAEPISKSSKRPKRGSSKNFVKLCDA